MYLVVFMLVFCNVYGCGLIDWFLVFIYGKLVIFVIGVWVGVFYGGIIVGFVVCGVMMNIVVIVFDFF